MTKVRVVPFASLTERHLISDAGNAAVVYQLGNFTLPGSSTALALKLYRNAVSDAEAQRLSHLIAFREELPDEDRQALDLSSCWPLALVTDGRRTVGILMPLAPAECFFSRSDTGEIRPYEIQYLIASPEAVRQIGGEAPDEDDSETRLMLAARAAHFFALLHKNGLTYGDVSSKNALYCLRPAPRLIFIDCDAITVDSEPIAAPQANSPFWAAPELMRSSDRQDSRSDTYKLGLLLLRLLAAADRTITQTKDARRIVSSLGASGGALMRETLSHDPDVRPSSGTWYALLHRALMQFFSPPELEAVELLTNHLVAGQELRLAIRVRNAESLAVAPSWGPTVFRPAVDGTLVWRDTPWQSGTVRVEASNRFGSVTLTSPPVHVTPPPRLREVPYPTASLQGLDADDLAALASLLTSGPLASTRDAFELVREAREASATPHPSFLELVSRSGRPARLALSLRTPDFDSPSFRLGQQTRRRVSRKVVTP